MSGSKESRPENMEEDNHDSFSPRDLPSPPVNRPGGEATAEGDHPVITGNDLPRTLQPLVYAESQKWKEELQNVKNNISRVLKDVGDLMAMPKAFAAIHDKQELFQGVLATFNKDVMAVHSKLDNLKLSSSHTNPGHAKLLDKLQKKSLELERSVTSLRQYGQKIDERLLSLETSHSGVFLWKIADYVEKKRDAMNTNVKSIYSVPFFTSQYGYKLRGRVFLMGDGVGKGTHISLFLTIMKGPSDAVLPWPFKERVTFRLINQDDPVDKSIVESLRPDPASSSFKRPTTEKNTGAGCPLFAKIKMIEDPKSGFLRSNTIYIKIVCQTPDVPEINQAANSRGVVAAPAADDPL